MSAVTIGNFALLSDSQTAALVGRDGSVDWYCPPRFDAPSVFARLLDPNGGHWSIRPIGKAEVQRVYLADTMVLQSTFQTRYGRAALIDALALERGAREHQIGLRSPHILLRRVVGMEGEVELQMEFAPRLEYALTTPLIVPTAAGTVTRAGPTELHLVTTCPLHIADSQTTARFTLRAGEVLDFALVYQRVVDEGNSIIPQVDIGAELYNACEGWRSWSAIHRSYKGLYVEQVQRSALMLQALTYQPSGAVVATPTTSLPETPGGSDNWDYRYTWLRDLSFTLRALWVAACPHEARRFFHWIDRALGGQQVQSMYSVEGERDLAERGLDWLRGFLGSRPVRVGNAAWRQKQLDVVDAAYLLREELGTFDDVIARLISALADRAAESWQEPDSGMWEARDRERPYLSAKVMCWVALDRALTFAPRLGQHAHVQQWKVARDDVRRAILERGWSQEAGAYTGAFGSDHLDASALLMPLVGFLPVRDPRMWATIETIERELAQDSLELVQSRPPRTAPAVASAATGRR